MNRAVAVLLILGGCGRQADFSGPAPVGAMQCSLEHALAAGYELIEGSPESGFLRLTQRLPRAPGEDRRVQPQPDLADVVLREAVREPMENQLLVTEERGRLSLSVLGLNDAGAQTGPGTNAEDQARSIVALCTSSPPVFPGTVGEQTPPVPGPDPI